MTSAAKRDSLMYSECDLIDDEGEEGEIIKQKVKVVSISNEINRNSLFQRKSNYSQESRPTLSSGMGGDDSLDRDQGEPTMLNAFGNSGGLLTEA